MPRIPGVSDRPSNPPEAHPAARHSEPPGGRLIESPRQEQDTVREFRLPSGRVLMILALVLGFAGVLGWWTLHAKRAPAKATGPADAVASDPPPAVSEDNFRGDSAEDAASAFTSVATLSELAKPWSAKKFTFVNPQTHERVPAMIVRLPGANAASKDDYWAFSLNAPYKTCQLDYLQNTADVASRYSYRASHPMVVAPCDGTLYDPLRVGTTPTGAWVRGDIAQGPGIRPPISIEIRVESGRIVADRIE